MEFKLQDKVNVQRELNISESQLDYAIKNMIRRHPLENWVVNRIARNGEKVVYLKLEFVEWLKTVYYNKEKFYVDLDIDFFKRQIARLEKELNISPMEFSYTDLSLLDLRSYFNKSKNVIGVAVYRMNKRTNSSYQYKKDGRVMISKDGVKWLSENYFRSEYLKYLELYKLELQKRKKELYEKSRTKI